MLNFWRLTKIMVMFALPVFFTVNTSGNGKF
jgi:hypothetical protein